MMQPERIRAMIAEGEGLKREFKECRKTLSKDVYETVCAFLNRHGGDLLLGVNDKGEVTGIDADAIERIKKDFVTSINNPQKIAPSVYLSMEQLEIDGRLVLYIYIPESSQVHRAGGKIFDRNQDGDLNITGNHTLVTALFMNKQTFYTENRVFPYCEISDLDHSIIRRIQKRASIQKDNHPWESLAEMEFLKSARLYGRDYNTGKEGITLAGILLFGKDTTILSALPHHKTDLILRRVNLDRYDDRDDVRTNLFDSYDRIIAFGQKHLNDPFYLEGTQRISVRDAVVREIAANMLIHREYTNAYPARMIIERDRIFAENGNKPHGHGVIDPKNFTPFPKNPAIARVFKEIGIAEELGSGVRNLVKYSRFYSPVTPTLVDEDVFTCTVYLNAESAYDSKQHGPDVVNNGWGAEKTSEKASEKTSEKASEKTSEKIISLMKADSIITIQELADRTGVATRSIERNIKKLQDSGRIKRIGADKGGYWEVLND